MYTYICFDTLNCPCRRLQVCFCDCFKDTKIWYIISTINVTSMFLSHIYIYVCK